MVYVGPSSHADTPTADPSVAATPAIADSAELLAKAQARLGITFRRPELLERSLTHSSYVNEQRERTPGIDVEDNEKLEFLGDAVIGLVVAEVLMERIPDADEGRLSRLRSFLVSSRTLAEIAQECEIGLFLRLGKGELQSGGATKTSILAAALEAVVGALYLDTGFDAAAAFTRTIFVPALDRHHAEMNPRRFAADAKTHLQERTQAQYRATPVYRVVETWGPEHEKRFRVEIQIQGKGVATGEGRSKKEAEQRAAQIALEILAF